MKKIEAIIAAILMAAVAATALAGGAGQIAIGTSPSLVVDKNNGFTIKNTWVILQNNSTNDLYYKLDNSSNTLTTTNGLKLSPGQIVTVTATAGANPAKNNFYVVAGTGTNNTLSYSFGNDQQP